MAKKMTVVGAGDKIIPLLVLYLAPAIYLSSVYPAFRITAERSSALWYLGIALVAIGVITNFGAAFQMLAGWRHGKLVTGGFYAIATHPMYTTHIFTTIPGLAFMLNSWLILPASLVLYLANKRFAKEEDVWLAAKFGREYEEYRRKVWIKIF